MHIYGRILPFAWLTCTRNGARLTSCSIEVAIFLPSTLKVHELTRGDHYHADNYEEVAAAADEEEEDTG